MSDAQPPEPAPPADEPNPGGTGTPDPAGPGAADVARSPWTAPGSDIAWWEGDTGTDQPPAPRAGRPGQHERSSAPARSARRPHPHPVERAVSPRRKAGPPATPPDPAGSAGVDDRPGPPGAGETPPDELYDQVADDAWRDDDAPSGPPAGTRDEWGAAGAWRDDDVPAGARDEWDAAGAWPDDEDAPYAPEAGMRDEWDAADLRHAEAVAETWPGAVGGTPGAALPAPRTPRDAATEPASPPTEPAPDTPQDTVAEPAPPTPEDAPEPAARTPEDAPEPAARTPEDTPEPAARTPEDETAVAHRTPRDTAGAPHRAPPDTAATERAGPLADLLDAAPAYRPAAAPAWPGGDGLRGPGRRVEPRRPGGRRRAPKPPRHPVVGMVALVVLAFAAAFFAWVSATPLWLAVGHGRTGVATVATCPVSGVRERCADFTATDNSFTTRVRLAGPDSVDATNGEHLAALMVSRSSSVAYAGDRDSLYLGWVPGVALLLLCGPLIVWATGARRLPTGRARVVAVTGSLCGPVLLLAGMLAATW